MPLDEQSRRLTQFVIGNQQYEFNRLFYGISIGPAAFSVFMSKIFRPLTLKKNAITYLDDVFLQSQTKEEMFTVLEQYQKILQNKNLKAAPDKSHLFLTRVNFLGHNVERGTITPLKSRIDAIQKLQPPTNKKKIQEFLGMLNFLSKYVYKMQLYLRPFYNILRQQNNFEWNTEHQTRFEEIKKLLTEQISNKIPDSNQPFYAMCDASNFGIGAALLQSHNGTNKMNLISANSRLFTQAELRLSTLMRECTAIIYTLTEYEFLILGSKHPTVLFTKEEMFTVLEQYQKILQNKNLKAAPDKSHLFLTRVNFLGHNVERGTITPLKSRIDAIQKLQPPTSKKKIQEFLEMLNFLSKYVYKMQLYLRPFYNILRQQNTFEWTTEHQTQFDKIKKLLTEQINKFQTQFQIQINHFMQCAMLQILALAQHCYNHIVEQKNEAYISKFTIIHTNRATTLNSDEKMYSYNLYDCRI